MKTLNPKKKGDEKPTKTSYYCTTVFMEPLSTCWTTKRGPDGAQTPVRPTTNVDVSRRPVVRV